MKTLFSVFAMALIAATSLLAQQDQTIMIPSGGIQRKFIMHLPSVAPGANLPVLLCYHGTGGTAEEMQYVSEFDTFADQYKFIAIYPQGVQIGGDIQWNVYVDDKPGHAGVGVADAPDDVLFTRDIIKYLSMSYMVDTKRVFASGFSNGGFMCYALSMLAPNDIKAIAPVAASMWGDANYINQLAASGTVKPMPVMHVHGTADNAVDYPDPDNMPKDYGEYPLYISARACNALTYSQVVPIMNGVDKLVFCKGAIEVSLIRITGMAHAWTNGAYPTSREIVKFFGLDGVSAVRETPARQFSITPNPATTTLRIELAAASTVQLINPLGQIVYSTEHFVGGLSIPCGNLPAGMYAVRILSATKAAALTELVTILH